MNWEEAREILEEIKKRTGTYAYSLVIDPEKKPELCDSKFGGLPYWDMEKEYPTDSEGRKLMLLAQINLEQMYGNTERDELLPETGMLQFFIALDDVYGMDFDEQDVQKNFRVIYHETIKEPATEEQLRDMGVPSCTDDDLDEYSPIWTEAALKITREQVCMGESDYRFHTFFQEVVQKKSGKQFEGQSLYQILDDDALDRIEEEFSNTNHWLLGYPYFTQTDPREYEEKYRYYDTLLFQMDSDYGEGEDYIMWGDAGVANFFINREDLRKKDFSKILYNWDCC